MRDCNSAGGELPSFLSSLVVNVVILAFFPEVPFLPDQVITLAVFSLVDLHVRSPCWGAVPCLSAMLSSDLQQASLLQGAGG